MVLKLVVPDLLTGGHYSEVTVMTGLTVELKLTKKLVFFGQKTK